MRNDNILFKKIWEDDEFFQVNVECTSSSVSANADIYIADEDLQVLHSKLIGLLKNQDIREIYWESGMKGDGSTPCLSLLFSKTDFCGHFRIEVFMEIDDGGKLSEHTCCFYIYTETQLVYNFTQRLPAMLNRDNIGHTASLIL